MTNRLLGLMACLVVTASAANAAVVAKDSYLIGTNGANGEYDDGGLIRLESNTVAGFTSPGGYSSGTGTSQFSSTSSGLVSAALGADATTSGKINYSAAPLDGAYRANARNLSPAAPSSGPYWIAHLVNRGSIAQAGGTGFVLTGFGNTAAPDAGATPGFNLGGLFVGFAQDGVADNFGNLVIRHRTAANFNSDQVLLNGATTSTAGTTYLVVAKIDMNVAGGTDVVTWWLNPGDGSSEATLTATADATGAFNSFALQASTDLVRLNYGSRNWNGNAFFDEPRLATDLAGLGLAVPEPAGLAAIAIGALALRRRRGN